MYLVFSKQFPAAGYSKLILNTRVAAYVDTELASLPSIKLGELKDCHFSRGTT